MLSSYTTSTYYSIILARWGSSRARCGLPCARSPFALRLCAHSSRPYKALSTLCFTGNSSQTRRHASRHYSSPCTQKNAHKGRFFWCTRWGSNPNSTASEAVMLSSYTTSTFVKFFSLYPFNRLKKFPECGIICIESTSILLFLPTESKRFR